MLKKNRIPENKTILDIFNMNLEDRYLRKKLKETEMQDINTQGTKYESSDRNIDYITNAGPWTVRGSPSKNLSRNSSILSITNTGKSKIVKKVIKKH